MTENPYAPSQASLNLKEIIHVDQVRPIMISSAEIFLMSFRLLRDHFWALCGIGLLWGLIASFAANSFFGLIAIPHLNAGLTLAGYRYYRKQGAVEQLFDGFQQFGPVLGFGMLLLLASLSFFVILILPVIITVSIASSADLKLNGLFSLSLSQIIILFIAFFFMLQYLYYYFLGRIILVYPLIVYFKHNVRTAFSLSWKATSASSHTIAFQHMLFDLFFPLAGLLLFCAGIIPALGWMVAFRGAVCGILLDHIYPDGASNTGMAGDIASGMQSTKSNDQPPSHSEIHDRFKPSSSESDPYS
jgi:hypothetical protein